MISTAMLHRSFFNQLADYRFVAEEFRKLKHPKKNQRAARVVSSEVADVVGVLLRICGSLSYFRLHKLIYLAEYHHVREYGTRLTRSYVIRQKDGPYFTELHIAKLKKSVPHLRINQKGASLHLSVGVSPDLFTEMPNENTHLRAFIADVVQRYKNHSDDKLKTAVYMTAPMRALLRREKYGQENLFNAPIDFSLMRESPRKRASVTSQRSREQYVKDSVWRD